MSLMKQDKTLTVLANLCLFSIFLDKAFRGVLPFDLYLYYPFFIIFLLTVLLKKGTIKLPPRWFNWGVSLIIITSFINLLFNGFLGFEFTKQVIGILFSAIVSYNVIYVLQFDIKRIFNTYLTFAFLVAGFGVIDNVLHYAGIHLTAVNRPSPFQYREYSIMGEPFYLAMALTPAVVYYMTFITKYWKEKKIQVIAVFLCYFLTYSSIAVTGLMLGLFFSLYLNNFFSIRQNRFALVPIVILGGYLLVNSLIENVSLINARFNDTFGLFLKSKIDVEKAGEANASTFALYSNYVVARDSFIKNPLLGSGLGSHPLIYTKTFLSYFPENYLRMYGNQNQQDANSKFLRLMSETGLVGLILFLTMVFKFYLSKKLVVNEESKIYAAINYSIFVYIILGLIRNGNYINTGFFLFFFMYYFSYIISKNIRQTNPSVTVAAQA